MQEQIRQRRFKSCEYPPQTGRNSTIIIVSIKPDMSLRSAIGGLQD